MNGVDPIASALAMLGIVYVLVMWAVFAVIQRVKKRKNRK